MGDERPIAVQIFGSEPDILAEAARIAQDKGADIVDINFGCPAKKVLKNQAGAALMKDLDRAEKIIMAVRKAVIVPLTIKMRSGWTPGGEQAFELARIAEVCGVNAVTIHPRTVAQQFRGVSDWSVITRIKERSAIPVIGNGDITAPEHVMRMRSETGCDAVMIGRGGVGNPWLFRQAGEIMQGIPCSLITPALRKEIMLKHISYAVKLWGEKAAVFKLRGILAPYTKTLPKASQFRREIIKINSEEQAIEYVNKYFEWEVCNG
ncbi:MAG: tRNA-dihydrouridine synthase [Pseudomonadota bacterium]